EIEILLPEEDIRRRVAELAAEVADALPPEVRSEQLVMVGLLKGATMFMSDFSRDLHRNGVRLAFDYMRPSSYGSGTVSSGIVLQEQDLSMDLAGRHVMLVDDIIDTGRTIAFAQQHLQACGVASLRTVLLTDKPSRREVEVHVDHVGFEVPNRFLVGYGLDADQAYRELPFIGVL
ncbi:MAG: hypoxanthine phosphoribosyltransferase, partial [Deltaproteobacteria bacterium]|nr:hypoxanthine phosphoribosyltransferase [Deltaproteobacteria bacterium]